jgi:diaminopimelate decarboxylase
VSVPTHPADGRPGQDFAPAGAPAELQALDPRVWPRTARRADGRALTQQAIVIGDVDVRDLATEHGTPVFILDETDFRSRASGFVAAYTDVDVPGDVFYAGKAFLSTTVVRWVQQEGLGLDVCSGGELAVAQAAQFPGERIAFHGNNKSMSEIAQALDYGVGRFVVDSFEEIVRLAALAAERGVTARVLIRVTVGVEAHTHEFIATAHEDQKFGFSLGSGAALEAARRIVELSPLQLVGLHSHIGSQIFEASGFEVAAQRLVALAATVRDELGLEVEELDLGGGMGIAYTSDDDPLDPERMARTLRSIVVRECERYALAVPRLAVEPGRAVVGPAMVTLYEVGTVKTVELDGGQSRTYVSVDGGMSENIRTALYAADYTVRLASRVSDAAPVLARVVGKHCESGDVVVRDAWLPGDVTAGDLLAVAATGAYCRSMASSYNHVPRPPVVSVRAGSSTVVLRRETTQDLLALDAGAP